MPLREQFTKRIQADPVAIGLSTMPLRFLGMGLYLAWLYSIHFTTVLFPASSESGPLRTTYLAANLTEAATLIACALLASRIAPLSSRPMALWGAGVVGVASTLIASFGGAVGHGIHAVILIVGSSLSGIATALLILLWSEFFASLDMRRVSIYYSASFVLATLVYFSIGAMAPIPAILLTSALPLMSSVMFFMSLRVLPAKPSAEANVTEPPATWSFPLRPVILVGAYSFAFSFSRNIAGGGSDLGMLGTGLVAALVLACSLFFFDRFDVRVLYRLALPLMVAGLLILPLFGRSGSMLSDVLTNASYASFSILVMIALSSISYRYGITAIWLFGLTRAARVLANVLGSHAGYHAFINTAGTLETMTILSFMVILVVVASMALLNDSELLTTWGINPTGSVSQNRVESYHETFAGRCAQVARKYGLTLREEEVLALLAQGMSVPRVESELFIARGTAKTHVRHIYAKLDIHSRDELIALVGLDGLTDPGSPGETRGA